MACLEPRRILSRGLCAGGLGALAHIRCGQSGGRHAEEAAHATRRAAEGHGLLDIGARLRELTGAKMGANFGGVAVALGVKNEAAQFSDIVIIEFLIDRLRQECSEKGCVCWSRRPCKAAGNLSLVGRVLDFANFAADKALKRLARGRCAHTKRIGHVGMGSRGRGGDVEA